MSVSLDQSMTSRDNNFNLIRFIAALLVLVSHSYSIFQGSVENEPLFNAVGLTLGTFAVDLFFITSGFLIASSFFGRGNLVQFLWARILRIYPALIVSVVLTVFVLGAIVSTLGFQDFLNNPDTLRYLVKNSIMILGIEYRLPGVFEGNLVSAVNGSMWTLPWEVRMYVALAVICSVLMVLSDRYRTMDVKYVVPTLAGLAMFLTLCDAYWHFYDGKALRLFAMFFVGSSFYIHRNSILLSRRIYWVLFLAVSWTMLQPSTFYAVYCIALPYMVLYIAYIPKGKILKFNLVGDYSYGLYIFAFPIQQSVFHFMPQLGFYSLMGLSTVITLIFAVGSWHLVERRALKYKSIFARKKLGLSHAAS